jgi:hypothetical protein
MWHESICFLHKLDGSWTGIGWIGIFLFGQPDLLRVFFTGTGCGWYIEMEEEYLIQLAF